MSRMLVLDRSSGAVRDASFADLASLLSPGDLLVLNDSRVIPARLYACRTLRREKEEPTGRIEVMLTEPAGDNLWRALVRPGRKVAIGERLVFPAPTGEIVLEAEVLERGQFGERLLQFAPVDNFFAILDCIGHMPLPPYIRRDDAQQDRERYQTVFSHERGSVAAPTAGLHFTPQTLEALSVGGVEIADPDALGCAGKLAVVPRNGVVGEHEIVVGGLADAKLLPDGAHRPLGAAREDDRVQPHVRRSCLNRARRDLHRVVVRGRATILLGVHRRTLASSIDVTPPARVTWRRTMLRPLSSTSSISTV